VVLALADAPRETPAAAVRQLGTTTETPETVTPENHEEAAMGSTTTETAETVTPENHEEAAMATTTTVDPVCGMTINAETAAASREIDDVTYYFCSTHCAATFDADPARYTTASVKP
jgi:P-type Cu+ transporter